MSTRTRPDARAAERARQESAAREVKRRRAVARGGGLIVLGLLAAIIAALASAQGGRDAPTASGAVAVPVHAAADGVVPIGRDDAPVTVTVFFDYMCPFCGRFEAANSVDLDRLVKGGTVRVELRPMSFLDSRSKGSQYSTRAANALATVADGAPDRVWDFHRALFREQPEEGTAGLSDERIADIARAAGVPAPVIRELPVRAFAGWVVQSTERAFGTGITGTPTVLVDQQKLVGDLYSAGALKDAVLHAARR